MQRERKYGRLNLGFRLTDEYEELELFLSTIPERKKAQAIIELYLFCKKKMGIEEVRNRLLPGADLEKAVSEKSKQYDENYKKYNQKYMPKRKKKRSQSKSREILQENVQIQEKYAGEHAEPEKEEENSNNETIYLNKKENKHIEETVEKPELVTTEEQDFDDYLPDMEALSEFF